MASEPTPPNKPASLISTLKDAAGGIMRVPSLEEVLDEAQRFDTWEGKPGHYYFSNVMRCFLRQWYEDRGFPCDHGLKIKACKICRFDIGKSEPGHATESRIRKLYADVLNFGKPEGPILNDVRFSIPVETEWSYEEESQKKPGKFIVRTKRETVHIVGKSDSIIIGDNLRVLQFQETKSPIFGFPAKATRLTEKLGTKQVPLSLAGVTEPDDREGVVSITQVVQLAIGCKLLEMRGMPPETAVLQTVSRGDYREHIEVIVTPEEWNFLYDLAIWWVKEHHANLQFDEPPEPTWFSVYASGSECRYCPVAQRCADDNKRLDRERVIHPVMPGISARLEALHGPEPHSLPKKVQASLKEVEVGKAKKVAKEAKRDLNRTIMDAKRAKKAAKREAQQEPMEPLAYLYLMLKGKAKPADINEEYEKFIEYGVPPGNAVKTILRHHGVDITGNMHIKED